MEDPLGCCTGSPNNNKNIIWLKKQQKQPKKCSPLDFRTLNTEISQKDLLINKFNLFINKLSTVLS